MDVYTVLAEPPVANFAELKKAIPDLPSPFKGLPRRFKATTIRAALRELSTCVSGSDTVGDLRALGATGRLCRDELVWQAAFGSFDIISGAEGLVLLQGHSSDDADGDAVMTDAVGGPPRVLKSLQVRLRKLDAALPVTGTADGTARDVVVWLAQAVASELWEVTFGGGVSTWRSAGAKLLNLFMSDLSPLTLFHGAGASVGCTPEALLASDPPSETPAEERFITAKMLGSVGNGSVGDGDPIAGRVRITHNHIRKRYGKLKNVCTGSVTALAASVPATDGTQFKPTSRLFGYLVAEYEGWAAACARAGVGERFAQPIDVRVIEQAERVQAVIDENPWLQHLYSPLNSGVLCQRRYRCLPPPDESETSGSSDATGADAKAFESARGKRSGGFVTVVCEHEVTHAIMKLDKGESTCGLVRLFVQFFRKAPELILYDNSCMLGRVATARFPSFFAGTSFLIDKFHAPNHSQCSPGMRLL
ncbi:MAG TPA: hypothetical protein EYO33_24850 [Phycisphaerales bacterium]|nr:hypothetical protein [Phycisphaerales bacterium]